MRGLIAALSGCALCVGAWQEPAQTAATGVGALAEAAQQVIALLSPEQRAIAVFDLNASERLDWHFIPRDRPGISLKDMSAEQQARVAHLMKTALGAEGAAQVDAIRTLDDVLRWMAESQGGKADHRDSGLYDFSVFGTPGAKQPWAFRLEGHHVSVTVASDGQGGVSFSPFFLGAAPARVEKGPHTGLRPLAAEQDLGLQLFAGLSEEQKKTAFLGKDVPSDLLIMPGAELKRLEPAGLSSKKLDDAQRQQLQRLIASYLDDRAPEFRDTFADQEGEAWFAWAGGGAREQLHYYRVQTARLVIEFVTTQGDVNHVHAYWRDLERDLTRDWMLRHLAEEQGN
jgi:hypothetical protein